MLLSLCLFFFSIPSSSGPVTSPIHLSVRQWLAGFPDRRIQMLRKKNSVLFPDGLGKNASIELILAESAKGD
jgi:hypothetical protein